MRLAIFVAYTVIIVVVVIIAAPISEHELDLTLPAYQLERRMPQIWIAALSTMMGVAGGNMFTTLWQEFRQKFKGKPSPAEPPPVVTVSATPPPAVATATSGASHSDVDQAMIETLKQMQAEIDARRKHDQEQDALLEKLTMQFESLVQQIKEDREHDRLQDETLKYILDKLKAANITHTPEEVQKALRFELGLNITQLSQPIGMVAKQWVKTHEAPKLYQLDLLQLYSR